MEDKARVYEHLFNEVPDGSAEDRRRWREGITAQRVKTVKAGKVLYVDCYPLFRSEAMEEARALAARREKLSGTSAAQKRVNARRSQRELSALANENFGAGDLLATLTFRTDDEARPLEAEDAKKEMDRFIRRMKWQWKKRTDAPMAYIYVIESTHGPKWGAQHHIHLLLRGGVLTELEVKALWRSMHRDARVQTDTVWDRPEGLTRWAAYVRKSDSSGNTESRQHIETKRRWYASKGLKRPKTTVADKKLTVARAAKIAGDFDMEGKRIFEKLYPGYQLMDIEVRESQWLPGAYIYAVMVEAGGKRGAHHGREKGGTPFS